ncbi:MAG: hypothetical protein BWY75_02424 [bacterium ADurb.Bin425]|nr:MAG: hypothetical protein BWY75_02424 [bacterium ADurb.Bin425]
MGDYSEVVNSNDVWMVQARRCLGFLFESLDEFIVRDEVVVQHLDCYFTSDKFLHRSIDGTGRALADYRLNFVATFNHHPEKGIVTDGDHGGTVSGTDILVSGSLKVTYQTEFHVFCPALSQSF